MAKFTIDNIKGLVETANGNGIKISSAVSQNSRGIVGMVSTATTASFTRTGGGTMAQLDMTLPKGALLTDVGFILTTALASNATCDVFARVGTTDGGQEICANKKLIAAATAGGDNTAIAANGSNSEGAEDFAFVASATMWQAAARTINLSLSSSVGNITTGAGRAFAKYIIV